MKELSIEEKAKAYDEAYKKVAVRFGSNVADEIFLKESEDEKIRKGLVRLLKELLELGGVAEDEWDRNECEKYISWLEKQGEQKPAVDTKVIIPKFRVGDIVKSKSQPMLSPRKIISIGEDCYWCEDRGCIGFAWEDDCEIVEQKPADKVEPKFRVDDWVVNKTSNLIYRVDSILYPQSKCYYLSHNGGIVLVNLADEQNYRLWTIQDAKDGDVLHSIGWNNDCIFIFNGIDNWKFDEPNGDKAVATGYCCLFVSSDKMEFGIQGPDCIEVDRIKPATKIQRDLLFQKMKESGYEWDDEKKKLKKIGQNTDEYIEVKGLFEIEAEADELTKVMSDEKPSLTDFERTLADICIGWIGEEPGWEQYIKDNADVLLKIAVKNLNSVQDTPFEQRPAWSEEDEHRIKDTVYFLDTAKKHYASTVELDACIDWLKSLKDRIQPQQKQEWSEEDEFHLKSIESTIEYCKREVAENEEARYLFNEDLNWLKSLCLQKQEQWNEQDIEMIDWLIRCCEKEYEELCNDRYGHQDIVSDLKRDCRKKWDWLESLKSKVVPQKQWKPSEEQIKAIQTAIGIVGELTPTSMLLKELREQLKNLND